MEAAATAELQRHYSRNDWRLYKFGAVLILLMASKMGPTCGWACALPSLCEAALFAALLWLFHRRRRLYLRHRSLILGAFQAGHQLLVSRLCFGSWLGALAAGVSGPACHGCPKRTRDLHSLNI